MEIGDSFESEGAVRVITDAATVFMPMRELVDFTAELERLKKELKKANDDKEFFEKNSYIKDAYFFVSSIIEYIDKKNHNPKHTNFL